MPCVLEFLTEVSYSPPPVLHTNLGMQDAAFSIICLKALLISLLLLCIVDGLVLQETKVLLMALSVVRM